MLPKKDALWFEAGYQRGYSKAIEDTEEHLGGLSEVAMPDVPTKEVLEPSYVGKAWAQQALKG